MFDVRNPNPGPVVIDEHGRACPGANPDGTPGVVQAHSNPVLDEAVKAGFVFATEMKD